MNQNHSQPRLQVWCPDVFGGRGGIQVFSRFFLTALKESYPDADLDVMVKHDRESAVDVPLPPNTKFHFSGYWPKRMRTLAFGEQLLRFGLSRRPSLIISTHLNFAGPALWLHRVTGVPYWLVAHGIEAWDIRRHSVRRALHQADRVFSVSTYTRDRLIENERLDPQRVPLLPDTFDPTSFNIAQKPRYLLDRYGLSPDQPVILTIARLVSAEQYKGYDKILNALEKIRRSVPGVRYVLGGRGDDRPRIEGLIRELGLEQTVTLAGYIPDNEVGDHYNLCDVFAMPSKGEGFGIVFLEALACGKPVLAGNKDGSSDALCDGALGALVNPDDTNQIGDTLVRILKGEYPHPIIYRPAALRNKVFETYGFERFKVTLSGYLDEFFQSRSASNPLSRQPRVLQQ